jgi:hypothetical protein
MERIAAFGSKNETVRFDNYELNVKYAFTHSVSLGGSYTYTDGHVNQSTRFDAIRNGIKSTCRRFTRSPRALMSTQERCTSTYLAMVSSPISTALAADRLAAIRLWVRWAMRSRF